MSYSCTLPKLPAPPPLRRAERGSGGEVNPLALRPGLCYTGGVIHRAQKLSRIVSLLGLILTAALVAACAEPASPTPDDSFVVADLFATPGKSLATVELTATPQPTATLANIAPTAPATLPLPTVIILREPTSPVSTLGPSPTPVPAPTVTPTPLACATPPLPFGAVWQNNPRAQSMMRCPVSDIQTVSGVWQSFEHGVMFWRGSDRSIFVISNLNIVQGQPTDSWWRIVDTW